MISLAGIVCQAAHESGIILREVSTMLVPTKKMGSGPAIQWRLFVDGDNLSRSERTGKLFDKRAQRIRG